MKQPDEPIRQNIFSASATTLSSNNATGTESLFSSSAGTSSIGVRGPGSLAGKVILNLGKITLQGVEKIIINRKLYAIGQSTFEARSPEMYKDVLELSRQGMYSDTIHFEAMRFLVKRIAFGQTEHLVDALRKWYSVEVRLLLSELIACFDAAIQSPSGPIDPIIQAYKLGLSASITADKDHSFIPFINFLRSLVSVTPCSFSPSSIVLEAGLLDFLLHLYATGFRDPLAPIADRMDYHHKSALSIACNSLLIAVYNDHRGAMNSHVQLHPIHALWPLHPALPPFFHDCSGKDLETQRILPRRESWRRVEKRWIYWRISSIYDAMADFLTHFEDGILRDDFMDLVQFAGSDLFNDEQLAFRALRSLHQLLHHGLHWPNTEVYFRYKDALIYATEVFPRIVQRLPALVEDPFHPHFFFDFDTLSFRQTVVIHFIQWICGTASSYFPFRRLMFTSGILELIQAASLKSQTIYDLQYDTHDDQSQYRERFLSWAPLVFKDRRYPPPLEHWRREMTWDKVVVRPQNTAPLYEWIDSLEEG